ncbi:hypothetical protein [Acinetobacter radioresistens]|uniref:hypothetical protein n=1 Tax=Acinetobacter radioresistens TaxID=40216 RepID=UPI000619FA9B|nr:hypothetical protein [Acinetobacter radioresistens]
MNANNDEGKLISGKEALAKVADGVVQYKCDEDSVADRWTTITDHFWDQYNLGVFLNEDTTWKFRLAPHTITINGIEVPAPFEPKEGDKYYYIDSNRKICYDWDNYDCETTDENRAAFGAWRTEEEIKQVVAALRQVFGGAV